ncbi:MAG: hypothetical protein QM775_08500 [Pirellulales bacterium]
MARSRVDVGRVQTCVRRTSGDGDDLHGDRFRPFITLQPGGASTTLQVGHQHDAFRAGRSVGLIGMRRRFEQIGRGDQPFV